MGRFQRQQGDNGYGQCGILLQPSQPTQCELVGHQPDPQPIPTQKPTRTPPHPPTPSQKHSYADPSIGCLEGETPLKVKYVDGQYCAPECTHASCPDAPIGVRGIASCGYRDQDVAKNYCGVFATQNILENVIQQGDSLANHMDRLGFALTMLTVITGSHQRKETINWF